MVTPFVTEKSEMKKVLYRGTIIGGLILSTIVLFSILVLGADFTSSLSYPTYILGKRISIGDFFERVEVIVAIIWIFTIYFKLTICYYGLTLGVAQLFGLKNYQILITPLAFLILPFTIFAYPNVVYINNFVATALTPFSLMICFFLPLLLLLIGKI